MSTPTALGEFLRTRRAQRTPVSPGTPTGRPRRVGGLRREEVARAAGVSLAYYVRLEQGRDRNASEAVLDALARALDLDRHERAHLGDLARLARRTPPPVPPEEAGPHTEALLAALEHVPAVLLGRHTDVLAWNHAGHALLAGHLDRNAPTDPALRPNWARLLFTDPPTRDLYVDWETKARDTIGDLHRARGRHQDDSRLAALTAELADRDPGFARLWAAHPVAVCAWHTRCYRHPLVGTLELTDQLLELPDEPGQRVIIYTAEPGSPSDDRLRALGGRADTQRMDLPVR